jgi:hypothetical protein
MGYGRSLAAVVAAALILAVGAPAASAAPSFQSPLVAAPTATTLPTVAVDGAGNAIAAYGDGTALKVASRPAGGAWQAPEVIADLAYSEVAAWAAFDGAGNATVAWVQSGPETGHVATRPAGAATFQPPQQIASNINPGLGVDFDLSRSGAALMTWGNTSNRMVTVARRPLGAATFDPQEPLNFGYDSARGAVGEDGTMSVTSHRQGEPAKIRVRPAGSGAWEPAVDLGATVGPLALANSAVDAAGNVLAIWVDGEGSSHPYTPTPRVIKARFRPAGSATTFAPTETVDDLPGTDAYGTEFFGPPQLAFDSGGNATLLWFEINAAANGGRPWRLYTSTRPAGGVFGAPGALNPDGPDAEYARLAVSPSGTALAVWRGHDAPPGFADDYRGKTEGPVFAAARVEGSWRAAQTLIPSRSYQPTVSLGANGAGAVGWIRTIAPNCTQLEVSSFTEGLTGPLDPPARACGPPEPPDTFPPTAAFRGEKKQRAHKSKRVLVTFACSEPCSGTAKAALALKRKGSKAASKPIRLASIPYSVVAGKILTLKFKLTSSTAQKLAAVLTAGGSASLAVTTTARDAAGNATPVKKTVKLIR